jgi:hypothetical protein
MMSCDAAPCANDWAPVHIAALFLGTAILDVSVRLQTRGESAHEEGADLRVNHCGLDFCCHISLIHGLSLHTLSP